MNLAVLDLGSTDSARVQTARTKLEALAHDPVVGPLALRSLVEHSLATYQFDEAKRFSDELLATPHVQFKDKLQHLTVLRALHSDNSDSWLATVKVEATTNSTSAAQTLEWLLKRGEAAQAMEWLQSLPEEIQSGQPMPLIGADCFAAVKDWHGLDARLGKEQWEELEFLRHAWLARAFREQKQHEIADLHWKSARALAEKRVEAFTALARLVASWGWKKETDEVLQAIVQRYPRQEWAWQELIRTRMAAGDTAGLYRTYKALLEQNTNSLAAKNNVAALGLLLKQDTDAAIERAQEVYEADTNNPVFVSTEAFALHEQGRTSEGLQLMEALPSKALQRPEIALYYVVLLSAAGERERAKPYYIFAEKADLLPEEQRLLDDSRKPR